MASSQQGSTVPADPLRLFMEQRKTSNPVSPSSKGTSPTGGEVPPEPGSQPSSQPTSPHFDVESSLGRHISARHLEAQASGGDSPISPHGKLECALAPGSNVDFPTITEICESLMARPSEASGAVEILFRALGPKSLPRRRFKALTILNELVYDPNVALLVKRAPGSLSILQRLQTTRRSGLGESADEQIRMFSTELERRIFTTQVEEALPRSSQNHAVLQPVRAQQPGWSLNLTQWPQELDVRAFAEAAGELVPRFVCLEVSHKTLGERRWKPTKDFEANRLVAAQLQLAPGTLLVLDETNMSEGQLTPAGVSSLKAISQLVVERTLACDFSSYDVNLPLELHTILVSRGRSIVRDVDLALPVHPSPAAQLGSGPSEARGLDAVRLYLGLATRLPKALNISEELAGRVAGDFCEARQEFQVTSRLCSTWLSLARAYCLSYGEVSMSEERWSALLELERERLRRLGCSSMCA